MAVPYHQWSSAAPFFNAAPPGLSAEDTNRLRAYDVYEQMYWNHPDAFKLQQRGEDSQPIYLPSAKSCIEATNRFLAVDWDFVINPKVGSPEDQATANMLIQQIFRREKLSVKFNTQRRYGLIWGDAIWHITADPAKEPGSRISIHDVHPARYFPIMDGPRRIGVHLVDTTVDPRDETKFVNRRQTYRRVDKSTQITSELSLWELGAWDDRNLSADDLKLVSILSPATPLDSRITAIPVYHIRNTVTPGAVWGSSEIRGIETVLAAANQGVSDQDLALVMAGLGVFWTDAAPPVDERGRATSWEIGPAQVLEVPTGNQVGRLSGVGSVEPSLAHIKFLLDSAQQGVGVPDIAAGKVDVTIAESGISLALQLAPILAKNSEKEVEMLGVYDHMFYDLQKMWLAAYEQFAPGGPIEVTSVVGDAMPKNRKEIIDETIQLATVGLITIEQAQAKLTSIGWDFSLSDPAAILAQQRALAEAKSFDPFANRYNREIEEAEASGQVTA